METVPETTTYAKKISVEEYNQQKDNYTQKALKELNEQMKTFTKPESNPRSLITSNKKLSISLPNSDNDDNDDNDDNNDNNDDNCGEDNYKNRDSDSDYEDKKETIDTSNTPKSKSSLNFIIKQYVNEQTPPQQQLLKKRKITNTNTNHVTNQARNQSSQHINTMSDAIYAQHELDMDVITNLKLKNNNLKNENEDLDTKKHFLTLELSNAQCEIGDLKKQISDLKDVNIKLKQYINFTKKQDDLFDSYLKYSCFTIVLLMIFLIYMSL